jgi:signal transduction histidine kinase
MDTKNATSVKRNQVSRLSIVLLVTMIFMIFFSLCVFLYLTGNMQDDGRIINISGRQRILSQKIAKTSIQLSLCITKSDIVKHQHTLNKDLSEFESNHKLIAHLNNSSAVKEILREIEPYFTLLGENTEKLIVQRDSMSLKNILENESDFLILMNKIVNQYQKENLAKIENFKIFIITSGFVMSAVLMFFVLLILRPVILENQKNEAIIKETVTELTKLNQAKDKFFSILAHDLKSPLNGIVGFSNLLYTELGNLTPAEISKYAGHIRSAADTTYKLLVNMLEWASFKRGVMTFNPTPCSLETVIRETIGELALTAQQKQISITSAQSQYPVAFADADMVKSILRNLISNSIKFSNINGSIDITATENGKKILVTVKDNGVGMTSETLNALFKSRFNNSTLGTFNEEGTGLGLMICKEFIEKHCGKLKVESEPGKGSSFTFTLPRFTQKDSKE